MVMAKQKKIYAHKQNTYQKGKIIKPKIFRSS